MCNRGIHTAKRAYFAEVILFIESGRRRWKQIFWQATQDENIKPIFISHQYPDSNDNNDNTSTTSTSPQLNQISANPSAINHAKFSHERSVRPRSIIEACKVIRRFILRFLEWYHLIIHLLVHQNPLQPVVCFGSYVQPIVNPAVSSSPEVEGLAQGETALILDHRDVLSPCSTPAGRRNLDVRQNGRYQHDTRISRFSWR